VRLAGPDMTDSITPMEYGISREIPLFVQEIYR